MKSRFLLTSVVFASCCVLAACGGGGGNVTPPGPTPTVKPTATPVTYSVQLRVQGGAMGNLQDAFRRPEVSAMTATPPPIIMMAPDTTDSIAPGNSTASGANLIVVADVSPAPSAAPSVTYSSTDPDVKVSPQPPDPSSTNIPGALAVATTVGESASSDSLNANVGTPVNTNSSRNMVIVPGHTLYVVNGNGTAPSGEYPAYTVTGGTVTGTNMTAGSDFYLTSDFQSNVVLNFPHGATAISDNTLIVDVTGSQWANTFTSYPVSQANARNPDGSYNNMILFKGSDGTICAYLVITNSYGPGADNWTNGPVRCGI